MRDEEEAWNDWMPSSPPSKRDVHRHGFNAGQEAALVGHEDMLKIALMEREWLLGAWAAACHIPRCSCGQKSGVRRPWSMSDEQAEAT